MALSFSGKRLETQALATASLLEGSQDSEAVPVERGNELLTPELDLCEPGLTQIGNFSPVYSPQSVSSEDSGILPNVSDDDYLLSSLFGVDFSLLPNTSGIKEPSLPLFETSPSLSPPSMPEISQYENVSVSKDIMGDRSRKNAEAARLNRQKKKRYVEDLEKSCTSLRTENVILKTKCHEYQQRCQKMQSEIEYLKSVIANESALSSLIQNIPQVKEVKLSSSFTSRKRPRPDSKTEENTPVTKRSKSDPHSGGVCLHVAKDVVSLEFCASCSKQAMS